MTIKKILSIFSSKVSNKKELTVPALKTKKSDPVLFFTVHQFEKWIDEIDILPVGETVYYLGYDNELEQGQITGYSLDVISSFREDGNKPKCELSYKTCKKEDWVSFVKTVSALKAFSTKELLLANLQGDILK